jgi:predicted RNA-binding Zn ribbon-like protein
MSQFDFDGGHLALDFANTAEWHASQEPLERLQEYGDLLDWSDQAATLEAAALRSFKEKAAASPRQAEKAYQEALALREALYRIFSAIAAGETPADDDLATLTQVLAASVEHGRLEPVKEGYRWTWPVGDELEGPLWPVVRAALDLLQGEQLDRVGECADDRGCGYLFLDTSRNHSRRWCSMESCGNRAKARSHYQRAREDDSAASPA